MNTITHKLNGATRISMSDHVIKGLRSYSPQGCPFIGYTLYDLLQDLIDCIAGRLIEDIQYLSRSLLSSYKTKSILKLLYMAMI